MKILHICPTFHNETCGIGKYTRFLTDAIRGLEQDIEQAVLAEPDKNLVGCISIHDTLVTLKPDVVHFQFEYSFASPQRLQIISDYCKKYGIKFCATFHSLTNTPHHQTPFDLVFSHVGNVERYFPNTKEFWTINSPIPPIEIPEAPEIPFLDQNPFLVFGQAHPHKMFKPIFLWAIRNKQPLLAIVSKPVQGDTKYYEELKALAASTDLIYFPEEYWSDQKILGASTRCKAAIFYYHEYGATGVSAAVKLLLANENLPIICNSSSHFADLLRFPSKHEVITWIDKLDDIQRFRLQNFSLDLRKKMKHVGFSYKSLAQETLIAYQQITK